MSHFDILLLAHLVGDYLFQTNWMAANKASNRLPLLVHSAVYTITIAVFAGFFIESYSLWGLLLIFVTHYILDRRTFTRMWVTSIMKAGGKEGAWLSIVVDQIFHLLVLFATLYL